MRHTMVMRSLFAPSFNLLVAGEPNWPMIRVKYETEKLVSYAARLAHGRNTSSLQEGW